MLERSFAMCWEVERQHKTKPLHRYLAEQCEADPSIVDKESQEGTLSRLSDWERPKNINKNSSSHIGHAHGDFIVPIRLSHAQIFVEYVLASFGVSVILNIFCEDRSVVTAASVSTSDRSPVIWLKYTKDNHHYGAMMSFTKKATEEMINRGGNQTPTQLNLGHLFSIETEGKGDCFFISLFFGIAYARGTPWIVERFSTMLKNLRADTVLKATEKPTEHLLLSLDLCNVLRLQIFERVREFESRIMKHVENKYLDMATQPLYDEDPELSMARQYILDQYTQDVDSFPDGVQIWSTELLNKVFDVKRKHNLNHKFDESRSSWKSKSIVLCLTHVQLAILEVLPSFGIYVDLDIFHCDANGIPRHTTKIRAPISPVRCLLCVDC